MDLAYFRHRRFPAHRLEVHPVTMCRSLRLQFKVLLSLQVQFRDLSSLLLQFSDLSSLLLQFRDLLSQVEAAAVVAVASYLRLQYSLQLRFTLLQFTLLQFRASQLAADAAADSLSDVFSVLHLDLADVPSRKPGKPVFSTPAWMTFGRFFICCVETTKCPPTRLPSFGQSRPSVTFVNSVPRDTSS